MGTDQVLVPVNLTPPLCDSLRPCHTQFAGLPKPLPVAFPYNQPVLAHASGIPKISQSLQTPNKQHMASACPEPLAKAPIPALVIASLRSQLSPSQVLPSPAPEATICRSLCSSYQVPRQGRGSGLPWPASDPLPRSPQTNTPGGQLQTTPEQQPITSANDTPKEQTRQAPGPCHSESCCVEPALYNSSSSQPVLLANPPEGQPLSFVPTAIKAHLQQEGTHKRHRRALRSVD